MGGFGQKCGGPVLWMREVVERAGVSFEVLQTAQVGTTLVGKCCVCCFLELKVFWFLQFNGL